MNWYMFFLIVFIVLTTFFIYKKLLLKILPGLASLGIGIPCCSCFVLWIVKRVVRKVAKIEI